MTQENSILLFVHPPFYQVGSRVFFDTQAQNGLRLWAKHFHSVKVMAPLVAAPDGAPPDASEIGSFLDQYPQIEAIMLPRRGTCAFLTKDLWRERKRIRAHIAAAQYLVFGFSGYIGDWGTVACRMAIAMKRPYAVYKDRVEHRVRELSRPDRSQSIFRRLKHRLESILMKYSDRHVVRKATLALLHGQDTMAYYSSFARQSRLVHDIHLSKSDLIPANALEQRLAERVPDLLRVAYAGRMVPMKSPQNWTDAINGALEAGAQIKARWYGTGNLFDAEVARVDALGRGDDICFMGYVAQPQMLSDICSSDVFVFCHMSEESPRCLIEALFMGLPLVGYDNAFARDLVGASQAGLFVPRGDVAALSAALAALSRDPERLAAMSRDARSMAEPLNDEDVFAVRSRIIKELL